jgi:hypothetical protein
LNNERNLTPHPATGAKYFSPADFCTVSQKWTGKIPEALGRREPPAGVKLLSFRLQSNKGEKTASSIASQYGSAKLGVTIQVSLFRGASVVKAGFSRPNRPKNERISRNLPQKHAYPPPAVPQRGFFGTHLNSSKIVIFTPF